MATIQNLVIEQGATFIRVFNLSDGTTPYDLSSYTIQAQIRRSYNSSSGLVFTTNVVGAATNGVLSISLVATETLTLKYGRYVYDIYLINGLEKIRAVEGIITVTPTVTR